MIELLLRKCRAFTILALLIAASGLSSGQLSIFEQDLETSIASPVNLSISLSAGDLTIAYSHEGEIRFSAYAKDAAGRNVPEEYFKRHIYIEQQGNNVKISDSADNSITDLPVGLFYRITYRLEVPNRTEVVSTLSGIGDQTLLGTTGPARLISRIGNVNVQQVRLEPIHVSTGKGNISCTRVRQLEAETGDGNITLMEDGSSKAVVKHGAGKIEVGGARGSFEGSTDRGTLHIKAVPHDDWQLDSASGTIRIELPPKAAFSLDAKTDHGAISINRDDIQNPDPDAREFHQEVNGGGKHIVARSEKGSIFVE
jgi:Putative adhesin